MKFVVKQVKPAIGKHKDKVCYQAKSVPGRIIGLEEVVRDISEMSSLTTGDVRNALDRIGYYLRRELSGGNTVQLGSIGTFKLQAGGKQVLTAEEVDASTIRKPRVQIFMGSDLRGAVDQVRMVLHNPFTRTETPSGSSKPSGSGSAPSTPGGSSSTKPGGTGSGDF